MPKITVATFNVHFGKQTQKIADIVRENQNLAKADIILLQEIESHEHEIISRAQKIADKLSMHHVYAPARIVKKTNTHGIAILSKYPIVASDIVQLDYFRLGFVSRTRIALNAEIEIGGEQVLVSNVHLDTRLNATDRIAQIYSIVRKLNEHRINKVVVAGDLNTMPFVWAKGILPVFYDDQRKKLYDFFQGHGYESKMEKLGYTHTFGPIRFSLDAIYAKGVRMERFGVEKNIKISDHRPVWADLVI